MWWGAKKTMNNRFKVASLCALGHRTSAFAREIMTAHKLLSKRAALIAAIFAGVQPNLLIPSVSPATKRFRERRASAFAAKADAE